jgi:hypothetical protein
MRSAITSHHVGRVDVIAVDEHARHPHHDIVRNAQSVGEGIFDGMVEAYTGRRAVSDSTVRGNETLSF